MLQKNLIINIIRINFNFAQKNCGPETLKKGACKISFVSSGTVVEHSTRNPKIEGLNPTTVNGRDKSNKKTFSCHYNYQHKSY